MKYVKRQDSGPIDDGWTVSRADTGECMAHCDTELIADAVMDVLLGLHRPGEYPGGVPQGEDDLEDEPEDFSWITLDTPIADYCRWEGPPSEVARVMAGWLGDLERVGGEVTRVEFYEVTWRMTLRQAFDIGWDFNAVNRGNKHQALAWILYDDRAWWDAYGDNTPAGAIERIRQLEAEYLRSKAAEKGGANV
jgi:hypothetical protein